MVSTKVSPSRTSILVNSKVSRISPFFFSPFSSLFFQGDSHHATPLPPPREILRERSPSKFLPDMLGIGILKSSLQNKMLVKDSCALRIILCSRKGGIVLKKGGKEETRKIYARFDFRSSFHFAHFLHFFFFLFLFFTWTSIPRSLFFFLPSTKGSFNLNYNKFLDSISFQNCVSAEFSFVS